MPTQAELYAKAHQEGGYVPAGTSEKKSGGVSEQNAPQNPAEVAEVTKPVLKTKVEIDLGKQNERMANEYKIAEATRGIDYQLKTMQDMIDYLNKPEDEETRRKREKRERSKRIIGAVSDGLRSLGNLFFTTRYAPSMYDHDKTSQLNATNAWIERMRAERERNEAAYYDLAMKIGDLNNQRAKTVREMETQQEARQQAREKAEREAERHKWDMLFKPTEYEGKLADTDKKKSDAQYSRVKAENAPEEMRLKNRNLELQGDVHKSTIRKNNAQAGAANRSHRDDEFYYNGEVYYNYDNLEKQVNKDIADYKERHIKRDASGKKVHAKKKVDDYGYNDKKEYVKIGEHWEEDPDKYEYDDTYIPIENGYWEETSNDKKWNYYDARDNAAKAERVLEAEKKGARKPSKATMPGVQTNDNNKMPGVK